MLGIVDFICTGFTFYKDRSWQTRFQILSRSDGGAKVPTNQSLVKVTHFVIELNKCNDKRLDVIVLSVFIKKSFYHYRWKTIGSHMEVTREIKGGNHGETTIR